MHWHDIPFTQIGLAMDIVGVLMIFLFSYKSETEDGNEGLGVPGINEEKAAKWKRNRTISRIGIFLLALGFALQFVGSIVTNP